METGIVVVERVGGKSTVSRCFSKYPLKLIVPNKVGSSKTDAVWIYTLSYGGGIVSARIGRNALLAVIPDPVTCFSTARYSQKQVFRVFSDSNLVIVDWITSGRHESGEKWEFELYKSTNQIFLEEDQPLFLDSVILFYDAL
ncbi:putative Urease accessory protein D [Cocos nucifera]|uniref:Putative Urease accessory protein D n=1 Tax=Cocos nucifera TaxID=13894 RepID=A0A8K0MU07_COCNU|nr:putative Urease accessory protein D [Cocos nucifera]